MIALLLAPFLPETAPSCSRGSARRRARERALPEALRWGGLRPGTPTRQGEPLFPRIERARPSASRCGSTATATSPPTPSTPTATPCCARARAGRRRGDGRDRLGLRDRRERRARVAARGARRRACSPASASTRTRRSSRTTRAARALARWLDQPRVVAVGECGLDYHYMNSPREAQRAVFAEQVALARERDLPVSIHVRGDDPARVRRAARHLARRGARRARGRAALLHRQPRVRARALDARLAISLLGDPHLQAGPRTCAPSPPRCRSSGCWSRRTLRCSRPSGLRGQRNEPAWVGRVGADARASCTASRVGRGRPRDHAQCAAPVPPPRAGAGPWLSEVAAVLALADAPRARGGRHPARALRDGARASAPRARRSTS